MADFHYNNLYQQLIEKWEKYEEKMFVKYFNFINNN